MKTWRWDHPAKDRYHGQIFSSKIKYNFTKKGSIFSFPCYKDGSHWEGDKRSFHKLEHVRGLNLCVNLLNVLSKLEAVDDVVEAARCEIEAEMEARNMSRARLCPRIETGEAHKGLWEGEFLGLFPDSDIQNGILFRKVSTWRSYGGKFPNLDVWLVNLDKNVLQSETIRLPILTFTSAKLM